jgi:hypothetical protein
VPESTAIRTAIISVDSDTIVGCLFLSSSATLNKQTNKMFVYRLKDAVDVLQLAADLDGLDRQSTLPFSANFAAAQILFGNVRSRVVVDVT